MPKKKVKEDGRYRKPFALVIFHFLVFVVLAILIYLDAIDLYKLFFITLGYFVFAYFLFRLFAQKEILNKEFRKGFFEIFLISLIALFFFLGADMLRETATSIELILPFENNNFKLEFNPQNNTVLNDLRYFYDFDNQQGEVSFIIHKINPEVKISNFILEVPAKIKINDFILYKQEKVLTQNVDFKASQIENIISFNDFKIDLDTVVVKISLQGRDLIPNGRFRFRTFAKQAYAEERATILFFSNNYKCRHYCFGDLINAIPEIGTNTMKFKYPKDYYLGVDHPPKLLEQVLNLNMFSSKDQTKRDRFENIYFSLLITSLVLSAEVLRRFILLLHIK